VLCSRCGVDCTGKWRRDNWNASGKLYCEPCLTFVTDVRRGRVATGPAKAAPACASPPHAWDLTLSTDDEGRTVTVHVCRKCRTVWAPILKIPVAPGEARILAGSLAE
jgi:hypothetical protein